MKTFVVSIPKSGTYMIRELLDRIGLVSSHLHVSERKTYDYSKVSIEKGRKQPGSCSTSMNLTKSIEQIPENSFAVGHLPYNKETIKILEPLNVLFLKRDFKETVISMMLFLLESGRVKRHNRDRDWSKERDPSKQFIKFIDVHAENMAIRYKGMMQWGEHIGVETFDYNIIKSNPTEQIMRLSKIHKLELSEEQVKQVLDETLQANTLTKSAVINRNKYWSDNAHKTLDALVEKYGIGE